MRRGADITQDEAAESVEISARALAEWEKGGLYQLRTLARLLDLYEATPEQRQAVMDAAKLDAEL